MAAMEQRERPEVDLDGYATDAPIVLATDYPPTAAGGGAVMLRSLIGGGTRSRVAWASLSPFVPTTSSEILLTEGSVGLRPLFQKRSTTIDIILCQRLADELNRLAIDRHARAFWIVMHGAMVHVAARLLKATTLPVHLTVHDDPLGVSLMSKRYLAFWPLVRRDFGFAIRRAASVDVVSEGMRNRYRRVYGVDSMVVHRGLEGEIAETRAQLDPEALEIGILGNTYGYGQLPTLANVLERAASCLNRRPRIVIIGQGLGERLRAEVGSRIEVEVTGHLNEAGAVDRLRRCFCLYLNYPFSRRASIFRQTSFPTKLTTYLMAARPLLANAPADSTISPLKSLREYVAWWESESVDDGAAELLRLWNLPSTHDSQHVAAERLRRTYFDKATNRLRLLGALNSLVGAKS